MISCFVVKPVQLTMVTYLLIKSHRCVETKQPWSSERHTRWTTVFTTARWV